MPSNKRWCVEIRYRGGYYTRAWIERVLFTTRRAANEFYNRCSPGSIKDYSLVKRVK